MNCAGASRKIGDILAIGEELGAQMLFIQELWEAFDRQEMGGTKFHVYYDKVAKRGAGLAILVCYSFAALCLPFQANHLECIEDAMLLRFPGDGGV